MGALVKGLIWVKGATYEGEVESGARGGRTGLGIKRGPLSCASVSEKGRVENIHWLELLFEAPH